MEDSYVIGLTGIMGSGKSMVAKIAKEFNVEVIDADIIAFDILHHDAILREKIQERWEGKVDIKSRTAFLRSKIMRIIMDDDEEYKWYMDLIMPIIIDRIRHLIQDSEKTIVLVDAPLLFEVGFDGVTDENWVVVTDKQRAVERVMECSGLNEETVLKVMGKQFNQGDKMKKADRLFWNMADGLDIKEMLWEQVEKTVKNVKIKLL